MLTQKEVKREIDSIVDQLKEKYDPEKIILFGSFARGEFNEDSDIDLFVVKKNPAKNGLDRIRELDRIIKYKIATDFIVYSPEETEEWLKLGDPFIKLILKEGQVLYDR